VGSCPQNFSWGAPFQGASSYDSSPGKPQRFLSGALLPRILEGGFFGKLPLNIKAFLKLPFLGTLLGAPLQGFVETLTQSLNFRFSLEFYVVSVLPCRVLRQIVLASFTFFFFVAVLGFELKGLGLASQELYHLSHAPALFALFFRLGLVFLPSWPG
jgi:hypothetical protein